MYHFTLRVTGPHFGNVFNITYTDVSLSLCDILTSYINETFKRTGVLVDFQSSLYKFVNNEFVKVPQASVAIALTSAELPVALYGMSNIEILNYLAIFTNATVKLHESNISFCRDTVVAQPVFMQDRLEWDLCIDCDSNLNGAQLCYNCLKNARKEHFVLTLEETIITEALEDILTQVYIMTDLRKITALKTQTWNVLNTLWVESEYKNKMAIRYGDLINKTSEACLFNGMVFEFIGVYYEGSLVDRHIWFPKTEQGTLKLRKDEEVEVVFYLVRSLVEQTVEVDLDMLKVDEDN